MKPTTKVARVKDKTFKGHLSKKKVKDIIKIIPRGIGNQKGNLGLMRSQKMPATKPNKKTSES